MYIDMTSKVIQTDTQTESTATHTHHSMDIGKHFYPLLTVTFQQHCTVHKARRWDWDKERSHNITSWSHL